MSAAQDRAEDFLINQIGLFLATRWMIRDIQPHLNDVRNNQSIFIYRTPEN